MTTTIVCRKCKKPFEITPKRGRPPVECSSCKGIVVAPTPQENFTSSNKIEEKPYSPFNRQSVEIITKEDAEFLKKDENLFSKEDPKEETLDDPTYKVFITNMGWAYKGEDEKEARKEYDKNVERSVLGYGQVGFEQITLFKLGKVVEHFDPKKELV